MDPFSNPWEGGFSSHDTREDDDEREKDDPLSSRSFRKDIGLPKKYSEYLTGKDISSQVAGHETVKSKEANKQARPFGEEINSLQQSFREYLSQEINNDPHAARIQSGIKEINSGSAVGENLNEKDLRIFKKFIDGKLTESELKEAENLPEYIKRKKTEIGPWYDHYKDPRFNFYAMLGNKILIKEMSENRQKKENQEEERKAA